MTTEQLPSFAACAAMAETDSATALAEFIYCYEPPGRNGKCRFRERLAAALSEAESAAVRRHLESEGPKPTEGPINERHLRQDLQTVIDARVAELEQRLDTMSRALAGVESMNRRLLELERMHGLTIARAH